MIGKIVTGKSFKGAVEYVLKKDGSRLLDSDGVDTESVRSVIDSFNYQRKARPEIAKVVAHISLSFLQDDAPRLTDEFMTTLAHEYMRRMNISNTQYIIVRHTDTDHPHIHIIYNRVRYDRKLVPDNNERRRNTKVCKALKQKYGLTFSEGKQNVKTEKLHGPDQVKYAIFKAIKEVLPCCSSVESLVEQLLQYNIATTVVHRGGDPEKEIQGMTFTMDGQSFKASQIDRKFSYANLCKAIEANRMQVEAAAQQAEKQRQRELAEQQRKQEEAGAQARQQQEGEQRQEQAAERYRQEQAAEQTQPLNLYPAKIGNETTTQPGPAQEESTAELIRYLLGGQYDPVKLNPQDAAKIVNTERAEVEQRKREEVQTQLRNQQEIEQQKQAEEQARRIGEIYGYKLSTKQQEQLYSPDGLVLRGRKNGMEYTVLFRPFRPESGPDILTRETLSQRKINDNPEVYGVRLTDEQVREIRDGQYIYLENMVRENGPFSGYFVADDSIKEGLIYQCPPDEMVQYGRFKMRIMDRDLIEKGYVVRALVEWYGGGQTARPYLWKDNPSDTDYKQSWNDPRLKQSVQPSSQEKQSPKTVVRAVPPIEPPQKQKPESDWPDYTPQRKKGPRL